MILSTSSQQLVLPSFVPVACYVVLCVCTTSSVISFNCSNARWMCMCAWVYTCTMGLRCNFFTLFSSTVSRFLVLDDMYILCVERMILQMPSDWFLNRVKSAYKHTYTFVNKCIYIHIWIWNHFRYMREVASLILLTRGASIASNAMSLRKEMR